MVLRRLDQANEPRRSREAYFVQGRRPARTAGPCPPAGQAVLEFAFVQGPPAEFPRALLDSVGPLPECRDPASATLPGSWV